MNWIQKTVLTVIFLSECIKSQQKYTGISVLRCSHTDDDERETSETVLYKCNGQQSCEAFLIFAANFPYDTVAAISVLTSPNKAEIAEMNNVTVFEVLPSGQEVIVPVNCSCSDEYYQARSTYQVQAGDTYFNVANNTYEGLSTCAALRQANNYSSSTQFLLGRDVWVPLRCACPTREQAETGTRFLVTYPIGKGDTLNALSTRFNASLTSIREANGLSDEDSTIYPFTTILIPMPNKPLSSYTKIRGINMTKSPLPAPLVKKRRSNWVIVTVGIAVGAVSLILLALVFAFLKRRLKITKSSSSSSFHCSSPPQDLILQIARLDRPIKEFKISEIKKATGNFAPKNKITGPTSDIYLGNFRTEFLAVEKKRGDSCNEVKILYQINHFNIVKLLGFCQHGDESYLVYEHMRNGALQKWLRTGSVDWKRVIQIALDVANGLLYLHNFANPPYVHNNISSRTVLLNHNLRAKISSLSNARTAHCNIITQVVGIKGYVAPECLEAGPATPKVGVFAFGGVLLELMTGKYPTFMQDGRERLLTSAMADAVRSQDVETELTQFIWPALGEADGILRHAIRVVKLSLSCLAQNPEDRPNMVEVVSNLLKLQENIHKPDRTLV